MPSVDVFRDAGAVLAESRWRDAHDRAFRSGRVDPDSAHIT